MYSIYFTLIESNHSYVEYLRRTSKFKNVKIDCGFCQTQLSLTNSKMTWKRRLITKLFKNDIMIIVTNSSFVLLRIASLLPEMDFISTVSHKSRLSCCFFYNWIPFDTFTFKRSPKVSKLKNSSSQIRINEMIYLHIMLCWNVLNIWIC